MSQQEEYLREIHATIAEHKRNSQSAARPHVSDENSRYARFQADLKELHSLPKEELERRWLEVQKKNEKRIASGQSTNPFARRATK